MVGGEGCKARVKTCSETRLHLLQACGSEHVIGEEEVDELEVDQLKEDLSQKAQEVGSGAPGPGWGWLGEPEAGEVC